MWHCDLHNTSGEREPCWACHNEIRELKEVLHQHDGNCNGCAEKKKKIQKLLCDIDNTERAE